MQNFQEVLIKAKTAFNSKLWSEKGFFVFDTTPKGADTVMSDQLCGMWYLNLVQRLTGAEKEDYSVFDKDKARKALQTMYKCNVMGTNGGSIGAANGYRYENNYLF